MVKKEVRARVNPRPTGTPVFSSLIWGGGCLNTPRLSRLLLVVEKNGKKRSKARSGATRISFRRDQSFRSGPLQTQSGPLKSQSGPYKARAGSFKARAGPPRPERAPAKPERAPPKLERSLQGKSRPLQSQSGPLKKPERAPPDISEGSADPFDPPPGCATESASKMIAKLFQSNFHSGQNCSLQAPPPQKKQTNKISSFSRLTNNVSENHH